jgi:S-formylglutathione hydrolase FrmB
MITRRESPKNGTFTLKSRLLEREVSYHVIFPANRKNFLMETPVLYLLHGLFGRFDNWLTNTLLLDYAARHSFAVVCPEGGDNWYADSPHLENHFYESCFTDELLPAIEEKFNFGERQAKRAIAGLSMGGYGAFKFAFRRPAKFCLAASMSGAFHASEIFAGGELWTELQPSIHKIFGGNTLLRAENDLFRIVENYPAAKFAELPFLYFDCGRKDSFLPVNIRLAQTFRRRGIAHQFKTFSGRHNWNYWNARLENILQIAARVFSSEAGNS